MILYKFFQPSLLIHQETVLVYLFQVIATTKSKTMETLQIAMISLPNFTLMQTHTNYTTLKACSRLVFTQMLPKLSNKLKIVNMLIEFYNSKLVSNMSLRKFNMPNHSFHKCQKMRQRQLQPKAACFTRKSFMRKPKPSSMRPFK